jgi:hypothetical protein
MKKMTDLVQTPPLNERSQRPSALEVVMLNIAIAIACECQLLYTGHGYSQTAYLGARFLAGYR